jgi:hypothetical protein
MLCLVQIKKKKKYFCIHTTFFTYYHRRSQKSYDFWYCSLKHAYLKATYDTKNDGWLHSTVEQWLWSHVKTWKNATFVNLIIYAVPWNWSRYSVSCSSFHWYQPNMKMLFAHLFPTVHVLFSPFVKIKITGVSPPLSSNDTLNSTWQTKSYTNKNPPFIQLIDIISLTINLFLTRAFMLTNKMDLQLSIQKYFYWHVYIIHKSINIRARIATLHICFI